MTSDELVHIENQKQAADQVSISNSIGSLRFLSSNNWRDFVENISVVENILRSEQSGIYPQMDFHTRDEYRHSVEKIAKASMLSESTIASKALHMANENFIQRPDYPRSGHLGFYLVGKGVGRLVKESGTKFGLGERVKRLLRRMPLLLYAGSSVFLAALMTGTLVLRNWEDDFKRPLVSPRYFLRLPDWMQSVVHHAHQLDHHPGRSSTDSSKNGFLRWDSRALQNLGGYSIDV